MYQPVAAWVWALTWGRGVEGAEYRNAAPLPHCAVADAVRGEGREAAGGSYERRGRAAAGGIPKAAGATDEGGGSEPCVECARDHQSAEANDCGGACERDSGGSGWRAGGAAHCCGRAGPGCGLLCVLRAQDVWADGDRRAVWEDRAAGGDAAVPGWRGH